MIPTAYAEGYEAAWAMDPVLAERYLDHATIGDPTGEAVAEDLASLAPQEAVSILARALQNPRELPAEAPVSLRHLMAESLVVPDWFDNEMCSVASRAFLRNSSLVLAALVAGSIVEGFATLISKSFRIRGRITSMGVRRLKQNGLHLVEQYLPGGVLPLGDGWRLSLRIRLVHARSRLLLCDSDEWDETRYGLPISAANLILAASAFSGRLMEHVASLGGDFTAEEREAYVHVWRYSGLLMGIPQEVLFHDEASARKMFRIGRMCEPPPGVDAIIMANSIISSAPMVIGITEPAERQKLASLAYRISRGLIGNELADSFRFPEGGRLTLPVFRLRNRLDRVVSGLLPELRKRRDLKRFNDLLEFANLGRIEHSYALPTAVRDEDSAEW
ncbi:MAG: oxygenase MpaB family protein [Rhodospirillales bacterium]|nr:oxygenase MpaB family protein [Rhodospirillales bacterium]